MSLINVSCELHYRVTAPTSFLFNVAVALTAHQKVHEESFLLTPRCEYEVCNIGSEGNRVVSLRANVGDLTLQYRAKVMLQPEVDDPPTIQETEHFQLPYEVLPYLNPSRYCESDRLNRLALREFENVAPGYSRVATICDWTHDRLDYVSGSTDARTSACDVLVQRAGVCRDYAHLAITLCRALCIPARYVSGYAVGLTPPDFHGFFEAYLGSRWYLFDATRMAPKNGLVRIGTGRDAADASFANIIGAATLKRMNVSAEELTDEITEKPSGDQSAISTA